MKKIFLNLISGICLFSCTVGTSTHPQKTEQSYIFLSTYDEKRNEIVEGFYTQDSMPVSWLKVYDANRKLLKLMDCQVYENQLVSNNFINLDTTGGIDYSRSNFLSICNLDTSYNQINGYYTIQFDLRFHTLLTDTLYLIYGDIGASIINPVVDTIPNIKGNQVRVSYIGRQSSIKGRFGYNSITRLKNGNIGLTGGELYFTVPSLTAVCVDTMIPSPTDLRIK